LKFQKSKDLYTKAKLNLVGGVNSPVRAFKAVGGTPIFIDKAKGCNIVDVDGNKYIDLVLSYGPMILGHCNKKVAKTVANQLKKGTTFGATTEGEIELAKIVCDAFPSIDKIRFVNSGTEAVMSAIRLARAFTGKDKIIKFSGCYHGHSDDLLVAAGSGVATLSLPASKGVTADAVKNTLIAEFNNIQSVSELIKAHNDIAAIIIEPIAGNMGVVIPQKKFIDALVAMAQQNNILIIADEVMTGFRSKFGGAQDLINLKADITCLGKVIGGGFPVGAYGAREEIMNMVAPLGAMYQAGTLSGNPVAMACGIATLKELKKQDPYKNFNTNAALIENYLIEEAAKNNIPLKVCRFGSMISAFFTKEEVVDFASAKNTNLDQFNTFFWTMMKNGVFLPPSNFEAWFLSTIMTKKDLKKIKSAISKSMNEVAKMTAKNLQKQKND
jgi:glutamate-1-semialdehyde 2,1-aminomutase